MTREIRLVLFVILLSMLCPAFLLKSRGAVEVLAEASVTVDGRVVADHAKGMKHPPLKEILTAFERAEAAVQQRDLARFLDNLDVLFNIHDPVAREAGRARKAGSEARSRFVSLILRFSRSC